MTKRHVMGKVYSTSGRKYMVVTARGRRHDGLIVPFARTVVLADGTTKGKRAALGLGWTDPDPNP